MPNIYGFASIYDSIKEYSVYPFDDEKSDNNEFKTHILPILHTFAVENGFEIDNETGFVHVGQNISINLSENFNSRKSVQEYKKINPKWDQGYLVYIAFQMNEINVKQMTQTVKKVLLDP